MTARTQPAARTTAGLAGSSHVEAASRMAVKPSAGTNQAAATAAGKSRPPTTTSGRLVTRTATVRSRTRRTGEYGVAASCSRAISESAL